MPAKKENRVSPEENWSNHKTAFKESLARALNDCTNQALAAKEEKTLRKIIETNIPLPGGSPWNISVNSKDDDGLTPLHHLALAGIKNLILLFLEKGADINAKDRYGNTPLHEAAEGWSVTPEIIKILISAGADINAINNQGESPLHAAAKYNRPDLINALISAGADMSIPCKWQNTPLHMAALCGSDHVIEAFLKAGASITARNDIGHTPFTLSKNIESARHFLNAGADINSSNAQDETLLHWVCRNDTVKTDIIGFLITHGAKIDAVEKWGDTPLHWAIKHGHAQAAKILIEAGANVHKQDGQGKTIQELAQMSGAPELPPLVQSALTGEIAQRLEKEKLAALDLRLAKLDALIGRRRRDP